MLLLPRPGAVQRLSLLAAVNAVIAKQQAPYGAWPSPLSAEAVAAGSVRLSGLWLEGADLYWTESRPLEQGRLTLLHRNGDGLVREIVPAPYSVRSRVHEYGGGAFTARNGLVIFANDSDQRLYRAGPTGPVPLTAAGPDRYADLQFGHRRDRLLCVVERAREGGEPENFLAAVALATGEVTPLVRGADFYAFPRLDPAGQRLAFLCWNHPAMPWDACELQVAEIRADSSLATPVKVAGGEGEAIFQPEWSPRGELTFVSDRSGFSNLYRLGPDGAVTCMCEMAADFAAPLWVFGLATHAWLDERNLACLFQQSGFWHLGTLDSATGRLEVVDTDLTEMGPIFAAEGRAVFLGGSANQATAIHSFEGRTRAIRLVHRPAGTPLAPEAIAQPRAFDFPTADDQTAHGLLYLPHNPEYEAPPDRVGSPQALPAADHRGRVWEPSQGSHVNSQRPPLLVICHGGPTASTSTALNPSIQFWTSRGFAVLDVNYRGSTGYGRAYRKLLDGQWGVADVEDCVAGASALAEAGLVDGGRMAIRGSSAGGFTVLCALAFHDVFAAGASYYGVCDLAALAMDTHKFESRYLDSLVGPYPACRDLFRARSPLFAASALSCPVIFFHGEQDRVVPKAQAEAMAAALRQRGLAAPLRLFPDEQHGFRRKESIRAALTAELEFYRQVFGIAGGQV
jgi:dienelactone hydrolase